jgi:hypothetical protein
LALCRRLPLVENVATMVASADDVVSADTLPIEPAQPRCCAHCGGTRLVYRELAQDSS